MAPTTKERIRDSTAELFRRHGYNGTGVKQIVAAAQAPFGSLYHHFPGGKEELAADVIRWSGAKYGELLPLVFDPAPDAATGVEWFFAGAAETLRESGYEDACPIATVALEVASTSEPLREATHEVFESWLTALAARGEDAGLEPAAARELALAVLASLEGAFVLSRAARSTEPMAAAGAASAEVVRARLA